MFDILRAQSRPNDMEEEKSTIEIKVTLRVGPPSKDWVSRLNVSHEQRPISTNVDVVNNTLGSTELISGLQKVS